MALLVAGTLTGALGLSLFSGQDDTQVAPSSDPSSDPASGSANSSARSTAGADLSATRRSIRACSAQLSRASTVVEAAAGGVHDWSGHVQARTDMLRGRLSVPAMEAIWKRTRLAGPADQSRFEAARKKLGSTSRCGELRGAPSSSGDGVTGCVARAEAATRAVATAETAMRDWQSHLTNMALHANGIMSSITAQRKWVSSWRQAPPHIAAYRKARVALDRAPSCGSPG